MTIADTVTPGPDNGCYFFQHGNIKEIRLVTYRNGSPKGLAYVEFDNEVGAQIHLVFV